MLIRSALALALLSAAATSSFAAPTFATGNALTLSNRTNLTTFNPLNEDFSSDTLNFNRSFEGVNSSGDAATTTFSGTAKSQAGSGVLRSSATATLSNPLGQSYNAAYNGSSGVPNYFGVDAVSYYSDTLTLASLATISSIKLRISTHFVSTVGAYNGESLNYIGVEVTNGGAVSLDADKLGLVGYGGYYGNAVISSWAAVGFEYTDIRLSSSIGVTGNQVDFGLFLRAGAYFVAGYDPATDTYQDFLGSDLSASMDAYHTLTVAEILAFDANGKQVDLAGATGSDGTSYQTARVAVDPTDPTDPNQVPEPASLALVSLGLAGIAAARRRKHAQA